MRKKKRVSQEDFKREIFDLVGDEYTVSQRYINRKSNIVMTHNVCKNKFNVIARNFLNGSRCPYCQGVSSKGEFLIESYLQKNNFKYKREFSFKDCKGKGNIALRFDFAVLNSSKKVIYLIEFDGKQHFEPISIFGGEKSFKKIQEADSVKNKYCLENEINLIRIPYYEFKNINHILDEKLVI